MELAPDLGGQAGDARRRVLALVVVLLPENFQNKKTFKPQK